MTCYGHETGHTCEVCTAAADGLDKVSVLRASLSSEAEPLRALAALLRLCRDDHRTLWEGQDDTRSIDAASRLREQLVPLLRRHSRSAQLPADVRAALVQVLTADAHVPTVIRAHVLADLIDEVWGWTFWASFASRSPYTPGVGDPIPLATPDLPAMLEMRPTAPPWRLVRRLDETRHVRLAGEWAARFRIVFDYSRSDALAGIVTNGTVIASVTPNNTLADFDLGGLTAPSFPLRPRDEAGQRLRVQALLTQAVTAGASVVVLPELAISPDLADELQDWVRRPGPVRLLVAGAHQHVDANGNRYNTAVAWLRGSELPLTQDKHSGADLPVSEGLRHDGWPEIRVHVSADGWHVALAVCRDVLNPSAIQALAEAGVNLLLVPAMSDALLPFGGPAAQLVAANQALVVVANGPAEWSRAAGRTAAALFGHPGLLGQTRLVHAVPTGPGVALFTVESALLRWRPAPQPAASAPSQPPGPSWVRALRAAVRPERSSGGSEVRLRPAAVLVLLSDSDEGLRVLLTRRSHQLRQHPGEWVLPGGRIEPEDSGPADAALREALEEAGVMRLSVHVLGVLPAVALPDDGWLVTPVVAWSETASEPRIHPAEVSAARHVLLSTIADIGASAAGAELGAATAVLLRQVSAALAATPVDTVA